MAVLLADRTLSKVAYYASSFPQRISAHLLFATQMRHAVCPPTCISIQALLLGITLSCLVASTLYASVERSTHQ